MLEVKRSHWVLDIQFREDESRARADNSAKKLNVLRHWAYNPLKADTSKQFKRLLMMHSSIKSSLPLSIHNCLLIQLPCGLIPYQQGTY